MHTISLLSTEDTAEFLRRQYGESVRSLRPLGAGAWSQAFYFEVGEDRLVIRWSRFSEFFERDEIASTYSSPDLPVPRMVLTGSWQGLNFAVTQFATGTFFDELSAADLEKTLPSFLAMLDAKRDVDLTATSGYGYWRKPGVADFSSWKEFLLSVVEDGKVPQIVGWRQNLRESEVGESDLHYLFAELEKRVQFCPENRELVHSDLINFNMLVHKHKISAVLDWGSSMYGDALYDIAWFQFYEPWYPHFTEIAFSQQILQHVSAEPDIGDYIPERLMAYKLHIGLGSIAYNAYQKDWKNLAAAVERTKSFL